jgi:hypothetical protein
MIFYWFSDNIEREVNFTHKIDTFHWVYEKINAFFSYIIKRIESLKINNFLDLD